MRVTNAPFVASTTHAKSFGAAVGSKTSSLKKIALTLDSPSARSLQCPQLRRYLKSWFTVRSESFAMTGGRRLY